MKLPSPLLHHSVVALLFLTAVIFGGYIYRSNAAPHRLANAPAANLRDGDVVFQDSHSAQSDYVKMATHSAYSHCGIYFNSPQGGVVYEAVGKANRLPTPWSSWVVRDHGAYKARRLPRALTTDQVSALRGASAALNNSNYDWLFEWSPNAIYCSELVWKAYQAIGVDIGGMETLAPYYQGQAKQILDERFERVNRRPNPAEKIVTPQRLFESDKLVEVR